MAVIDLPDQVSSILSRPDLRELAAGVSIRIAGDLPSSFVVSGPGEIVMHPDCASDGRSHAVAVRHALELLLLRRFWPTLPALAALAAARTAALFAALESPDQTSLNSEYAAMAADTPISAAQARALWASLARHQPGPAADLPPGITGLLARIWPVLGPTEWLLQAGGAGLSVDPATGLNGYGCSYRPRPWAASFASAAASSSSERGYGGAEAMRRAVLADIVGNAGAVGNALASIRGVIRTAYGLPPGTFVALAPSGADGELFALAAAQGEPAGRPVTVVLMAPEEIGSGVLSAVAGRHFAADTARGAAVQEDAVIAGFRDDTQVRSVALRTENGAVRPLDEVAAECGRVADEAVAAGRRVLLHRIDTSETGLLAPNIPALTAIQERHPDRIDVVVDASQARLSPDRVGEYLALGWIVLLTGSKFLIGPPLSGAVLFPETLRDRFARPLPEGLRDYSGRAEWPPGLAAASGLHPGGNVGLALRWAAALAELRASNAVPAAEQRQIIGQFISSVRSAVAGNADLHLIDVPSPRRADSGTAWDEVGTILSFALHDPTGPGWLPPNASRQVCAWLDADLSACLPEASAPALLALAHRRFHVGPPIKLSLAGSDVGVLRISVGARLVSGEPSHAALGLRERMAHEIADAEALLQKISLILRHWPSVERAGPPATYV